MSYDIIVRFPSKKIAGEFCGQMSDGAGEGICDFSFWQKKENTDGNKNADYIKVTSAAPEGTPVYFVQRMFDL